MRFLAALVWGTTMAGIGHAAATAPPKDNRVEVTVGDYRVELRESGAWTFGNIYFGRTHIGLDNGWYGLVLARPNSGWIGTGHTESGTEKVERVRLLLDGQEAALTPGARYKARHARLEKSSRIDNLALEAVYEIAPDGISEMHRIEAVEDQPVKTLYAFMHAWTPTTKHWLAEGADGQRLQGDLLSHDQKVPGRHWPLSHDVRWTAVYDPTAGVAIVLCYPEVYRGKGIRTGIWDLQRYHKEYYQPYADETLPKGTRREFRCRVWCVPAEPAAWQEAVATSVAQRAPGRKDRP